MSLSQVQDLAFQNAVLRNQLWASQRKTKTSEWFFLVDTKHRWDGTEHDKDQSRAYCDNTMEEFAEQLDAGEIVELNRKTHTWTPEYINDVRIRYVCELGNGKLRADGTKGRTGGTFHIHALVTVIHTSNISLEWETLRDFFTPRLQLLFGNKPFVGRPRLTNQNRVVEYMEKGFEEAVWNVVR